MKKLTYFTSGLLLLLGISTQLQAQDSADILDRMISQYSNSLSGIETMMTITRMEGFMESEDPDTTYYRKVTMDDGTNTLEAVDSSMDTPGADYYNFKRNYDTLVENSTYEGTETIDGRNTHVIFIEDVSAFYGAAVGDVEQGGNSEPQSGRFYIDASDYVPLRMSFDVAFDGEHSGSVDVNMKDYRSVNGVMMSFLTEMNLEGISEQFSAEDLAEARQGLRDMREQLENASGMQKRIMERAIAPQLERLEKILEEGSMNMSIITISAEANVTIPE